MTTWAALTMTGYSIPEGNFALRRPRGNVANFGHRTPCQLRIFFDSALSLASTIPRGLQPV